MITSARQQQYQDEVAKASDPRSAHNKTSLLLPNNDGASPLKPKDYSKTPNIKERQQSHFRRFKYSVSGVDDEAKGTSFLPAVHGQEHLKKKVNKAQFLTINESERDNRSREEEVSVSSFRASENNPHVHKVRDIIRTCLREGYQGAGMSHRSGKASPFRYMDHALTEISMKKKDLELVLGIMRDLEGNETVTFE